MTVSKQNVKVKADIFASKLADYVINHTKTNKNLDLDYNDSSYKKHRILLTKIETLEISELIAQEKRNKALKVDTLKEKIINTLNTKLYNTQSGRTNTNSNKSDIITNSSKIKTLSEKKPLITNSSQSSIQTQNEKNKIIQEKPIFELSNTMVQELSTPPRQSVEVKGASNPNKEIKQDFVKMKALTFISKITNKISSKKEYKLAIDNVNEEKEPDNILWNLKIGETNKKDTLDILKKYSKEKTEFYKDKDSISYSDISITVYFNKKNILSKIDFNEYFNGETLEGLKIGDTIEKAMKLYGKPISYDKKIIKWKNFSISCLLDKIFSISVLDNSLKFKFSKTNTEKFVIYTHGFLLGIILQNSTKSVIVDANDRKYVINFMKDYSNIKQFDNKLNYIDYDDIGIKLFFNEKDVLSEIEVSSPFKGKTINELRLGDSVEKAISIYGHPQSSDANHLMWGKLKALVKDYIITSINLKKQF